jgi:hypothetical protein
VTGQEPKKKYLYVGETCRSAYERGFEHLNDIKRLKPSSHMLKHLIDVEFRMEVLSFSCMAYERQIMEAVEIQLHRNDHHLLNSRAEFNRSAIPRLGLKLGDNEYKERKGEEREEEEREETILAKIRELKKKRNRERGSLRRAEFRDRDKEPRKKKRKVDYTSKDASLREEERIIEQETEKRRQPQISGPKRKQMKLDSFLIKEQPEARAGVSVQLPDQAPQYSPGEIDHPDHDRVNHNPSVPHHPVYSCLLPAHVPQDSPGERQPDLEIDYPGPHHHSVQLPAPVPQPNHGERQPGQEPCSGRLNLDEDLVMD